MTKPKTAQQIVDTIGLDMLEMNDHIIEVTNDRDFWKSAFAELKDNRISDSDLLEDMNLDSLKLRTERNAFAFLSFCFSITSLYILFMPCVHS